MLQTCLSDDHRNQRVRTEMLVRAKMVAGGTGITDKFLEEAWPQLVEAAMDEDWEVRKIVLECIVRIADKIQEKLSWLFYLSKDKDWRVRILAIEGIARIIDQFPEEAWPQLVEAAKDENWKVRKIALECIASMAVKAPEKVWPALAAVEFWGIRSKKIEIIVSNSIVRMADKAPEKAWPLFVEGLEEAYFRIRQMALLGTRYNNKKNPREGLAFVSQGR